MTKETTTKNQITEGVIWRQLLIFFFPIVIGTLFQQLYNTVDAIIVGRFVGKQALASVGGSAAVLSNLVIGFFTGLSAGATVIISQHYGAKNKRNLRESLHTAYAFSIIASLILAVLGWILTPWLLTAIKTPADVLTDSILYLRIYFLGMISVLIFNMGSGIMRAIGDSKRPLYYLIICCLLNIVLDVVMVLIFRLGIAGVAVATVISQSVSAVLVTRALMTSYDTLKLSLTAIRISPSMLRSELRIGFPSGLESSMYGITNIIIQAAVNEFGTDTAAAWAAYGKLDAIFWTVCGAFGIAITTFSGQNYGAKRYDRVFKSVRVCLGMSFGICGSLLIFLVIFCRPLFHIFTTDLTVVKIGVYMLRYITPSYIVFVIIEILSGALRGIGDVLIPTLITLGGVCCVRLPWILLVVPRWHQLSSVMVSYPMSWMATAILLMLYYLYRKKHLKLL
ncbi:MAG: MATE family efflux transporter [Dorea sp.]|jgi:putative MATE family efflux protein|nr:MATE family efflux transporter [Dorea sp.]